MTEDVKRSRRQFLLLVALFAAPLVAAYLFYFVPDWQPREKTNYGELIDPARPVPPLTFTGADGTPRDETAFRGKWTYVYLGRGECDEACRDKLHQIRQIRTLLNEKRLRVQRVYVAPDAQALGAAQEDLAAEHPDLVFLAEGEEKGLREFLGTAPPGTLFLIDPLGNYLMRYAPDAESKGIHKDIKRLLRISQIG